jgi:two-component system, NtrC family, sensor histidine kinase KinB
LVIPSGVAFPSKLQYLFSMTSLRYKIGFYYFVIVFIALATSAFAVYNFSRLRDTFGLVLRDNYESVFAGQYMVKALERQENAQLSMLLADIDLAYVQFNTNRVGFLGWLEKAKRGDLNEREKVILDLITVNYFRYTQLSDSLYRLLQVKGQTSAATNFKTKVIHPVAESLKDECFDYLAINQDAVTRTEERLNQTADDATLTVITISLVAVFMSIYLSARFTKTILRPAGKLTQSVRRISEGQLNQKIDVNTDDEIGELGREFNKMTERLREYEQINIHQLIAEKKKSETIVESIADPLIVTDNQGSLMLMNQAAATVFDVRGSNWYLKSLHEVIGNESWAEMLELNRVQRYEKENRESLFAFVRNNVTMYFRPRQAQIMDEQGKVQGIVTLLQDVTRFKDLDRMKSEFIATVSHELRTPLTSLSMGIDILSQGVVGKVNKRQRELLFAAKDDSERLRKLVKGLLDLSKLESGKYEMKKELVNFRELVAEAVRPLRLPFEEKQIELELDVTERLPSYFADPHQLIWVVTNLLSNALRYTDQGGKVKLTAKEEESRLLVTVTDTGHGIPREHQETVFDKFVQVKGSTQTTPGSVGLGLAIAREVVEAHGGRIWLESTVGVGSKFFFTLPAGNQS